MSFTLADCRIIADALISETIDDNGLYVWGKECLQDNIPSQLWQENSKEYKSTVAKRSYNLPSDFFSLVSLLTTIGSPTGLTVTPTGTTGTTTYKYQVTAVTDSGETIPCSEVTSTSGNATLSETNYNALSWTEVEDAASYNVYRTYGGNTTGLIGTTTETTFDDTGLAGDSENVPTEDTTGSAYNYYSIRNRKISFTYADNYALTYVAYPTISSIYDNVPLPDACEYPIAKFIASRFVISGSSEISDDSKDRINDALRWMAEFKESINKLINEMDIDGAALQVKLAW